MTFIRNRRVVATIVAASCMYVPASAAADALPSTFRSDAAQSGNGATSTPPSSNDAPHDTIVGDDINSHVGMPGAPKYDPPITVEVVRPERTIVRDVDQALPLVLSGTALLLVLTGIGFTVVQARRRPAARSH